MERVHHVVKILVTAIVLVCLPDVLMATVYAPEPMPFRGGEQLSGSDFNYNRTSFLDRFSFRPDPDDLEHWRHHRRGFAGSVGSTTSVEFLSAMRFFAEYSLTDRFSFAYRFIRDEDFDGVYDNNLVGFRLGLNDDWNVALFGDVIRDKEDIDAQVELTRGSVQDNWFRLVYSLVDLRFNAKQEEAKYRKAPRTVFAEWMARGASWDVLVYANQNFKLRMHNYVDQQIFEFRQFLAGLRGRVQTGGGMTLHLGLDGEWGERSRKDLPPGGNELHFDRRFGEIWLELGATAGPLASWRLGLRNFSLQERSWYPDPDKLSLRVTRREPTLWLRYKWVLSPELIFSPRLYHTRIDNREQDFLDPAASTDHELIMGKIALPLEWRLGDGAYLVLNPTMYTHKMNFGGMNFTVWFPF